MTNAAWFMCYACGNHVTEGYWLDIDGEDSTFYCKDCAEERIADGMQREWFREQPEVSDED